MQILVKIAVVFFIKKIKYCNSDIYLTVKVMWHTAKYGDPYSEFVLCINPSNVPTHISEHTHSVNTHPEQWAAIYVAVPGEQLGVRCLTQGHLSRGIEGEVQLDIHSPHLQLPNSQPFDYESNSQTIRPWHVNIRLAKTNDQLVFNWLLKQHKEISCPHANSSFACISQAKICRAKVILNAPLFSYAENAMHKLA